MGDEIVGQFFVKLATIK